MLKSKGGLTRLRTSHLKKWLDSTKTPTSATRQKWWIMIANALTGHLYNDNILLMEFYRNTKN